MSIVEIAPTCAQCDDSASSCSTCGGYSGWPNPPNNITLGPCRKCVEGIAAAALNGQAAALANPAAVRAAWMIAQGWDVGEVVESLRDAPPTDLAYERSQLDAAIQARDPAPVPIAIGDDDSLILVDDEPDEAAKLFAKLAVEAVNAKASAEWEGDDEPTQVLDRAEVIAQLAPIEDTWRKTWTDCADLLKAVAEKDPAAAAGYVASCRNWLTRAVQYGS